MCSTGIVSRVSEKDRIKTSSLSSYENMDSAFAFITGLESPVF